MARRSHTETFVLLRNNATKKRYFYKEFDNDDERVHLVNGKSDDANDIELINSSGHSSDSLTPNWVSNVDEFRYESNKINTKLDQLNVIQREHLKSKSVSIFSDDSESAANQSYEIEIEFKCQEINKLFNRLHSLMSQMQNICEMKPQSKIVKNVFQWQCKEIQDLTQKYRICQKNYLNKCTENDKIDEQFVITFDKPSNNSLTSNGNHKSFFGDSNGQQSTEDSIQFFEDLNQMSTQKQVQKVDPFIDSEHLKARDQEMTSIVKSIVELNQVFHDINTLVINQGSVLDRIDYNVETVQHRVEEGVLALSKAEKSMRSARKLKLILILSGVVILMLMYLIIFKA